MTDVDSGPGAERPSGQAVPPEIATLESGLAMAFHALDDIGQMSTEHRTRVVDDVTAGVPDAASAAARAGHAAWAERAVRAASARPPAWSSRCSRWDAMLAISLAAISAVGEAG